MILIQRQKYKKGLKANGLLDCSGTKLAEGLGCDIYTPKIPYKKAIEKTIINFGCSKIPWLKHNNKVINKPLSIQAACNKHATFKLLRENDIPTPWFTTDKEEAAQWLTTLLKPIVFCRTLVNASKGKGIVIARDILELVDAPLYTRYIPKSEEYRVHVAFNEVIHLQKKKKLTTEELVNRNITPISSLIRNAVNGYIFSTNFEAELGDYGSYIDPKFFTMTEHALHAIKALCLDFGAVDVIVSKEDGKVYVLEVNTAPGLEEPTLSKYVEAIKEYLNQ